MRRCVSDRLMDRVVLGAASVMVVVGLLCPVLGMADEPETLTEEDWALVPYTPFSVMQAVDVDGAQTWQVPLLTLAKYAPDYPQAYKLRGMERKHILKRAVADLLPDDFFRRRKMGFSPPLTVWFRSELRPFLEDVLAEERIRDVGVFRPEAVRRILDDHYERRANYDNQIWALLSFLLWQLKGKF